MSEDCSVPHEINLFPNESQNSNPSSPNNKSSEFGISTTNASLETNKKDDAPDESQNANPSSSITESMDVEVLATNVCAVTSMKTENEESTTNASLESKKKDEVAENTTRVKYEPDEAVLVHLLEMCKVYDLADETGR